MTTEKQNKPVAPYMAIGLSTTITGIAHRKHIRHNLENIEEAIHAAVFNPVENKNLPGKT